MVPYHSDAPLIVLYVFTAQPGLGYCHGKNYFCQDSGKNRSLHYEVAKTL